MGSRAIEQVFLFHCWEGPFEVTLSFAGNSSLRLCSDCK